MINRPNSTRKNYYKGKYGWRDWLSFPFDMMRVSITRAFVSIGILSLILGLVYVLSYAIHTIDEAVRHRVTEKFSTENHFDALTIPLHAKIEILEDRVSYLESHAKIIIHKLVRRKYAIQGRRKGKKTLVKEKY